jgi:hypothetical protein
LNGFRFSSDWRNGSGTCYLAGRSARIQPNRCIDRLNPPPLAALRAWRKRSGDDVCHYAWRLRREYSDALARKTFRFSIAYLSLLFAALLVDHYFVAFG